MNRFLTAAVCLFTLIFGAVAQVETVPDGYVSAPAAPISLTALGIAATENFDTLSNTAGSTTNNLAIAGWAMTEAGGGARDNEQYAVDTGASNTGDTYSFGAAASTERALGSLRSGTLISTFGASYINNTGSVITSLDIAYTGEQWRLGTITRADQLDFQYSTDAADLVTGTWIDVNALDFVTPFTTTVGARDGNAAGNRTAKTASITGLSIPVGATFWIRWNDADATGADDGLSVDDFSLTPQGGAPSVAVSVSGRVTDAFGRPIRGAYITATHNQSAQQSVGVTNSFGYFQIEGLASGQAYTVSIAAKRFTFSPSSVAVTPADDISDLNFQAQ